MGECRCGWCVSVGGCERVGACAVARCWRAQQSSRIERFSCLWSGVPLFSPCEVCVIVWSPPESPRAVRMPAATADDVLPSGEQIGSDGAEELVLTNLPPDTLHAIARQLVCVRPHRCATCALTSLRAVKHLTTLCTALRSALLADEVLWSLLLTQREEHWAKRRPRRVRSADTAVTAEDAEDAEAAEAAEAIAAAESCRVRCGRVWGAAGALLASLPRLAPDPAAASLCSGVAASSLAPQSMPLSDAVEIERWQRAEEQARAGIYI